MNFKELDTQYIANTYARFPLYIEKGVGSFAYDENGKEYIDLGTGIAVNSFGYCDSEWINAVTGQLNCVQHTSNLFYSKPDIVLAQMLCEKTGMKKVFFSNSGAEANECAIKCARKYAADKKGAEYNTIITLKNSFHGRTITTLAATGQDTFHKDFLPLTQGFCYVEANNIEELEKAVQEEKVAAIMFELVQGEGGVLPLEYDFVQKIAELSVKNDIIMIADEVQTGNGRTGELYAYMNYQITPDIVTTAKGLGGGLPIGATLFGTKTENVLAAGSHGSTFGGNPVCCAGAANIISRIDRSLLNEVKAKSDYIIGELSECKGISNISGLGLMLGFNTERDTSSVVEECREKGVIVIKAKDKIRLLPALNIPWDLLERAIEIIKEVCENGL